MSFRETKGRFETGQIIATLIREAFPSIKIICSSAYDREKISGLELFDFIRQKPLLGISEVDNILKLIAERPENTINAIDAVKLAPTIFGVGIDLKELIKWLKQKVT